MFGNDLEAVDATAGAAVPGRPPGAVDAGTLPAGRPDRLREQPGMPGPDIGHARGRPGQFTGGDLPPADLLAVTPAGGAAATADADDRRMQPASPAPCCPVRRRAGGRVPRSPRPWRPCPFRDNGGGSATRRRRSGDQAAGVRYRSCLSEQNKGG